MTSSLLHGLGVAAGAGGGLDLLRDLALIMCVAAVTTVVFQKLRQPVVLGYLLAGVIVGPHVPVPLFADEAVAHTLSELGVILLMFSLGLEFSLRKLVRVGGTAGIVAVIQCSLMIWLGYLVGRAFGWTTYESLFCGALIAISSTTIIVKAFAEQGIRGPLTELVFGVLIVEDLIAILLLAVLTPVASGAAVSAGALAGTVAKLVGFLVVMLVVGMVAIPRLMRLVVKLGRKETTVVASVGICFGFALLARTFGYSVALGAFIGGALVAESGESKPIEQLIEPVRDVFAAVFFVSVGMLIHPGLVAENWLAVLVLTVVVVVGKLIGVTVGAFIAGHGVRTSVQAGLSLAQIGEFSFIIAGVGLALGATRHFLYPVAVAVSAVTTLLTPWLIRASGPLASLVDRRLPRPIQTYASLYGSWVEQMKSGPDRASAGARIRRLAGLLLLDAGAIAGIVIAASLGRRRIEQVVALFGVDARWTSLVLVVGAALLTAPFALGAVRLARALGVTLAMQALPASSTALDLAAAPRRALLVGLQLSILLAVGFPIVAFTQPFLPSVPAFAALVAATLVLIVPFWRSAADLQGHVRAGAQIVLEALSAHAAAPVPPQQGPERFRSLVPGLGDITAVPLRPDQQVIGQSLKQLNLRALTGATVIAIDRGEQPDVIFPEANEVLRAGDTLVLTGSKESMEEACKLLRKP